MRVLLEIFKRLAKFGGHILLYRLIIKFVFGYGVHFYKVKNGYYLQYKYVENGYRAYSIIYREDKEKEVVERLKYHGIIKNDGNSRTLEDDLDYIIEQEQKRGDKLALISVALEECTERIKNI